MVVSRRSFLAGAATVLATGAVASCGRGLSGSKPAESALEMTFWGEGDQNKKLVAALDVFQSTTGTKVNTQYSGLQGYFDKLATRLAGGNPPDIFQVSLPFLREYADRGTLLELDQYSGKLGLDKLPASVKDTSKLGDHWYYQIIGAATQPAIVADTTMLKSLGLALPPTTWDLDAFRKLLQTIRSASGQKLYGTADFAGNFQSLDAYLRASGKGLFTKSGQLGFETADLEQWLQLWDGLRADGSCVPMTVTAAATGFETDPVATRKAAFTATATSRGLPSIQSLTKDSLDLLPFPGRGGTNIIATNWFGIAKKSKNVDKAVDLLSFLVANQDAAKAMGLARGIPMDPELRKLVSASPTPLEKKVLDNYTLIDQPDVPPLQAFPVGAGELLNKSLGAANEAVGFKKATVANATKQFFADAKRLIK